MDKQLQNTSSTFSDLLQNTPKNTLRVYYIIYHKVYIYLLLFNP